MKKTLLTLMALVACMAVYAADPVATVTIVYSGTSASVTIPSSVSSYVTCSSGTSSHVVITQSSTTSDNPGEIAYDLSGTSTDGSFTLTGEYKCEIDLSGVTLTNPSGAAIDIENGKRIAVSAKKGTTNTLTDGASGSQKACLYCKGHLEFKGKGELTVYGNTAHAISAKEYVSVKNLTLKVASAVKDGIHCKEYFLMESGTVSISGVGDDGIQVELDGTTSTGTTTDHEDEDSGNFYQEDGSLTISSYGGKAIKADGTITKNGGTWTGFTDSDTTTAIQAVSSETTSGSQTLYDLQGRQTQQPSKGIYIIKKGNKTQKAIVK